MLPALKCPDRFVLISLFLVAGFLITGHCVHAQTTTPADSKQVLVLNSYHNGFLWSEEILASIREIFDESGMQVDVTAEFMDTKLHAPGAVFSHLVDLYEDKFQNETFDVVMAVDNNALDFTLKYRARLFPDVPIVFCGVNSFKQEMIEGHADITGVSEDITATGTLELMKQLHPSVQRVAIISDISKTGQMNYLYAKDSADDVDLEVVGLNGFTRTELQEKLKELPNDTGILFLDYYRTPDGETLNLGEGLSLLSVRQDLPVYSLWEDKIREGVVGGVIATGSAQGEFAADLVIRLFNGEKADEIPVVVDQSLVSVVRFPELEKFGIELSTLPEGTEIRERPASFYSKYKNQIQTLGIIIGIMAVAIILLLMNTLRRVRSEEALKETSQRLEHVNHVLEAIRKVNKLITREKDLPTLMDESCRMLVETRGFFNSWIILFGNSNHGGDFYHAGFDDFESLVSKLNDGELPPCGQATLDTAGVHFYEDPPTQCAECPILSTYNDRAALTIRLEHEERVFGILSVSLPKEFASSDEEQALFEELAGDLSFSLWSLETKQQREATERKYEAVLTATREAVVSVDTDGIITLFNPGAEELFKCFSAEAIGTHFSRFCPEEYYDEQESVFQEVLRNGSLNAFETVRQTADGMPVPVETSVSVRYDEQGNPVGTTAILRDISERKQAEGELLHSQEMLNRAQAIAHAGSWEIDLEQNHLKWSDEVFRMFGFKPGEFGATYDAFFEAVHPDDRKKVEDAYQVSLHDGGKPYEIEHRIVRNDTREIRIVHEKCEHVKNEDGKVIRSIGMVQDITERKQAEAEQQAQKEQLALTLDVSAAGAWQWNVKTDSMVIDDRFHEMLGYSAGELPEVLEQWEPYHHPDEFPAIIQKCESHFRGETPLYVSEHRIRKKDGQWMWVLTRGRVVSRDGGGNPERFIGVAIDITTRKNEEHVQAAQLRLVDFATHHTVNELLQALLDEAEQLTDSRISFYHFVEEDQQSLSLQAWSSRTMKEKCKASPEGKHYPLSKAGVWVDCVHEKKPVIHNDYASLPHKQGMPEGHAKVIRELVVPVFRADKIVGILGVGNKPVDYTDDDVAVIQKLADLAWEIVVRKQAEESLRESEEMYRVLIKGLPDIVMRFDREARHLYVSDKVAEVVEEIPLEQYIGKTHRDLGFPDELCDFCEENVRKIFETGQTLELEYPYDTPARRIHFEIRAVPERDPQGNIRSVLTIGRDVTEQRRVRRDYRKLFTEMLNGFALHEIICDDEGTPVDYRFLAVNPAFERLTQLKASDIVGKTILEVLPQTERQWIEIYGHVALTGEPAHFEEYSKELEKFYSVTAYQPAPNQFACIFEDTTERKRSEDALRESEEKFRQIAENVSEVFWVGSTDWGEVHYVSPAYEDVWGKPCQSLIDSPLSWIESVHPDDRELMERAIEKKVSGEDPNPEFPEYRIVRPDGVVRWIHARAYPVHDVKGRIVRIAGIAEDITERIESEQALRASEANYRTLFESMFHGVFYQRADGQLIDCNPALETLFGFDRDQILGRTSMHPEWKVIDEEGRDVPGSEHPSMFALRTGKPVRDQVLAVFNPQKQGFVWLNVNAIPQFREGDEKPFQVFVTLHDITDRKHATEALKESESKFRNYITSAPNGVFVANGQGQYVEANEAAEAITGYSREELLRMNLVDLVPPEDLQIAENHFQAVSEKGKASGDFRFLRKDGELRHWTVSAVKLSEDRFLGFVVDITERKKAEDELREARIREMEMAKAGMVGLWDWNLVTNETSYSTVWKSMLGYDEHEIDNVFGEWRSRVHPDDFDPAMKRIQQCIDEVRQDHQVEFRMRHKDGTWRWILSQASAYADESGKTVQMRGSHIDITDLKNAEILIRESEEKYRLLFDSADILVSVYDREGVCQLMNKRVASLFDGQPQEFIGKSFHDLHPELADEYTRRIRKAINSGTADVYEDRVEFPQGARWLLSHVHPVPDAEGVFKTAQIFSQDITDRKKAEQEIRKFKTIADKANYGCAISDLEGNLEYINPYFAELHGYAPEELIGQNLSVLHSPQQLQEVKRLNRSLLETGSFSVTEVWHTHRDGNEFPMLMVGAVLKDAEGYPQLMTATAIDMTEQKELEDQLRQAQKMEAVGQLAGGVAHDFNNLLQAIMGFGEIALADSEDNVEACKSIEEILRAGDRAASLVSQLLAYSRRQVLKMEDLDLNDAITEMLMMIQRIIGEHIQLDILPGHNLGTVRADRGQISQILANLCVNARDAMPEGGRITIETENVRINEEYCQNHSWAHPGRFVLLSITDTGCGMDEETISKVFEPFFTTKDVGKGTGLGLSTVYGLVRQHDGLIHVYSEAGKGTTFKIYLPLIERVASSVGSKIEGPVPGGTETILLAEDDETVCTLTRTILERAGYKVITAVDGEEALEMFDMHAAEIQLAILDVVMPKMSGRAVFDQIQQSHPDVKVIFASGYSMNAVHTNFVLEDGFTLIQKPCPHDDLLRKVRATLDEE